MWITGAKRGSHRSWKVLFPCGSSLQFLFFSRGRGETVSAIFRTNALAFEMHCCAPGTKLDIFKLLSLQQAEFSLYRYFWGSDIPEIAGRIFPGFGCSCFSLPLNECLYFFENILTYKNPQHIHPTRVLGQTLIFCKWGIILVAEAEGFLWLCDVFTLLREKELRCPRGLRGSVELHSTVLLASSLFSLWMFRAEKQLLKCFSQRFCHNKMVLHT